MEANKNTLDKIFIPFFKEKEVGTIVTLAEMNWHYDYFNRSGSLMKEELEYLINEQINKKKIKIISPLQYKVVELCNETKKFSITQDNIKKADHQFREEFKKIQNESENT